MGKANLGIIGGGQLGSMLASAAKKIDIKTVIFCDDANAPAQKFSDEFIFGKYDDEKKIYEFLDKVDLVTFEFENIPYETLKKINKVKKVFPKPEINKIIQNRVGEKNFLNKSNINTTKYASINNYKDFKLNTNLLPGILKTSTLGYDGKGQYNINSFKDFNDLNLDFKKEYILEKLVDLKKEISVILTRFSCGKYEIYEPIENLHENQILKHSKIPATINEKVSKKAKNWAIQIAEKLDYIGTISIEYFIDQNDELFVNEIAPRVHNSGHLTINSYNISQFENHIRAIFKLDQIKIKKIANAEMINILGEDIKNYRNKKFKNNEYFFDYFKNKIKPKRKMGHITVLKV